MQEVAASSDAALDPLPKREDSPKLEDDKPSLPLGTADEPVTILDDAPMNVDEPPKDEAAGTPDDSARPQPGADATMRVDGAGDSDEGDEDEEDDEPVNSRPEAGNSSEDEGDEEEEEAGPDGERRPKKRRKRKEGANRFLDLEVEVDTDEEEEEDEDGAGIEDGFIVGGDRRGSQDIDEDEEVDPDDDTGHRDLERSRQNMEGRDAEDIARELDERNRERRQRLREAQEMGDSGLPRNALMPDVNDPTLWGLKVKRGRERDIVQSIFRKAKASGNSQIISAFCRDTIEGYVYIEARAEQHIRAATYGIIGVYANNNPLLVPLEERADLLTTKRKAVNLQEGGWVRLKRGKYAGDLAQILEMSESGLELTLKYIPRIDFMPKEEGTFTGSDGRKRKKGAGSAPIGVRPPPALFNPEQVKAHFGKKAWTYQNQEYHFAGDDYRDGFLIKEHRLNQVETENINPTIDEVTRFAVEKKRRNEDGEEEEVPGSGTIDYAAIAEAQRRAASTGLQPGDSVEIWEGEQKGIIGLVELIDGEVVTIAPSPAEHPDLANTKIEVLNKSVRKRFKMGDHIKVMTGTSLDESGLITNIEGDVLTFISDLSQEPKQVFSRDVREAAEVGANANVIGDYALHDLVLLDQSTSGVIFRIERDMFRILDQTGTIRNVKPAQITGKIDSTRSIAADSQGIEIRSGDMVKETTSSIRGEGRSGRILHVYRSLFAFLHNRDLAENGGVFVVNVRYLQSQQPKATTKEASVDLSRMNPNMMSMAPPPVPASALGRGPARDPIEGMKDVYVRQGPYKGHKGIVKDVQGPLVRIELETTTKLVSIEREKLVKERPTKNAAGVAEKIPIDLWITEHYRSGPMRPMAAPNQYMSRESSPYVGAGAMPQQNGAGLSSRTPNPYALGAGGVAGRTPNPYASAAGVGGGKTPNPYAAGLGGKTPNPYAAGLGGKTPNPYAAGAGGKTPNPYADGGATPLRSNRDDALQSSAKGSAWDASAKTPYISNDDRAGNYGSTSSATPKPSISNTPAAVGTGAYGSYQGQTPRPGSSTPRDNFSGAGSTPRDRYDPPTPRDSYGGRSSYGGPSRQEGRSDNVRFGTSTNTAPLGAPSRYGSRADGDPPTPRGAPTPATRDYANTPYGAPTPADRGSYNAPTPSRYEGAPTPGREHFGAPTPGPTGAPTPGPSSYNRDPYDRSGQDRQGYGDYRTPAPARGAPTPGHYPGTPASYPTPRDYPAATPGGSYGQTPGHYTGAPTPAAGAGSSSSSEATFVPPDWPEVGLEVLIVRDAKTYASFAGARFDDFRVVITSVPPHKPYEQNFVHARLATPDEGTAPNMTLPPIPINFIEIIRPTEAGQKAMIVGTGKYRREVVTCKSLDEGSWLCGMSDGRQEVVEARLLCLYAK